MMIQSTLTNPGSVMATPFEELTSQQRGYLFELIELQETGDYNPQMHYLGSFRNGNRMLIRPTDEAKLRNVKQAQPCDGITTTDLQTLASEGYITLTQPGKTPLAALKQKSFREYEIEKTPQDAQAVERLSIGSRIFIGHGHSLVWLELRDFLENKLVLLTDEFNRDSTAGLTTPERLEQMLEDAGMAFLILTAEDQTAEGDKRPRENVVHEAGLFQGRLGFRRAIILLEEGCTLFSNVHGLTYIKFQQGNIRAAFEDIRNVLSREGLIESKNRA